MNDGKYIVFWLEVCAKIKLIVTTLEKIKPKKSKKTLLFILKSHLLTWK